MKNIYALYKGDTFIDMGTISYLAIKFNVKKETIKFYATPTYKKRIKKGRNALIVIKVDDI